MRFAEAGSTRSRSTTSAGRPGSATADRGSSTRRTPAHHPRRAPRGHDSRSHLRATATSLFTIGFCGGRLAFLSAGFGLRLAVIGFYGWPVGPSRNGTPAPAEVVAGFECPVLGIFGGADEGIGAAQVAAFEAALAAAGVEHRITTYDGAPHSFFDRKADAHAEASAQAWDEVIAFIRGHGEA
jgi:dienelactone hydrolase